MNKKLLFLRVVLSLCLLSVGKFSSAQIIFSEDWSSSSFATNNWTFPAGQSNWTVGAQYTPTGGAAPNAFFNWNPTVTNYSNELVTPVINATAYAGGSVFLSYKFQLNNYSTATLEQFAVEYKTVGSGSWFLLTNYSNAGVVGTLNWAPTNIVLPGMAGQNFQIRFRPYGPNSFNINGWGVDDIQVLALNPCTGTPVAGTASALPANPCPGDPVTLSLTGATIAGGLAYQWQRSTVGPTGPWTNIGTANPLIYNPPAGSTSWYRCIVTCTATGLTNTSATSPVVIVQAFSATSPCYCTPTNLGGACITNVSFGTLNNTTPGCTGTNNYNFYTTPVANFTAGNPYTFSITTDANAITSVWIDYNHNTLFEPSEWNQIYTNSLSGSITFPIPFTALAGQTRMRVRSRLALNQNGSGDACLAMGSGETEDYIVNINPAGPFDPTLSAIVAPIGNACTDSFQTLSATVYNYGSTNISTFIHPITVTFTVAGPTGTNTYSQTIGGVLGSPTLFGLGGAPPLTFTVNNVNMFNGGFYYINAVVSCPTVGNASLSNDSLPNAIVINNYRPTAGPDYALCQYSSMPFGQGLSVGGCSAPLFDSVTINFNITGPCSDGANDAAACQFATGIVPTLIAGAQINSAVLKITNLATQPGSWTSEMRFNLYTTNPAAAYSGGVAAPGSTGAGATNYTYTRPIATTQLGFMATPGTPINIGYWESFNDVAGASDISINSSGTTVASLKIYYQYVPPAFSWYDVPTGGSSLYSLTPFNPLAFSNAVVNNSNVPGLYTFYAACLGLTNCRVPVRLSVKPTPTAVQDSMMKCEYAVGANNAIFDLPSRNSIVSGGLWPAANVDWYGDQYLLSPILTPATDTSSTNVVYSKVYYTYANNLQCATSDTMYLQVVSIPQYSLPIYTGFACAPSAIDISSLISIFPPTGNDTLFFNDPLFTSPYTGNPHAINVADTLYMIVKTSNSAACKDSATAYIDVLAATNNIANQDPGNFSVCGSVGCGTIGLSNGNTATLYTTTDCRRIATVTDNPTDLINLGNVSICQDIDCAVGNVNGQPYVNRHYEITPTTNGKAQVCLYYLQQDFDDYNSAAFPSWPMMDPTVNLCINQVDNGDINTPGHTAISIPNAAITSTYDPLTTVWTVCFPVDSFSYFYCATCNDFNIPLPVSLLSFEGKRTNGSSVLNWATSSEQNNSHFIVERSKDGKSFSALSSAINSKGMNGNSNVKLDYTHTDDVPMKGHNYYRLRQVDIDGHYTYSGTVDVYFGTETFVTMYPNPVNTELTVDITTPESSRAQVKIMDATGRVVRTVEMSLQAGSNSTKIDMQSLTDGMYMVSITDQEGLNHTQTIRKK